MWPLQITACNLVRYTALSAALLCLLVPARLHAQDRDFLSADEVEQVRLTQEPNARLMLYNKFAEARALQVEDLLKNEKPGRSVLIHDLLEDLVEILDTIDTVADDALMNNMDIAAGMQDVVKRHTVLAAKLKQIDQMELSDRGRYQFQLQMALDTVNDSLELAQEDLAKRKGDVLAKDKAEKVEREALRTPQDVAERKEADRKQAEQDKKTGRTRKPPTLYKPGEKPGEAGTSPSKPK
jgi:hypothetical protein